MNKHYSLLLRSFDTQLSDAEQQQLADALQKDSTLQEQQTALATMRKSLKGHTTDFDPLFSDRVMARWHTVAATESSQSMPSVLILMTNWFPKIAIAAAIITLMMAIEVYYQEGSLSFDTLAGLNYLEDIDQEETIFYFSN